MTPSTAPPADPVLVEILRGDLVESRHRGAAVVVDAKGKIVACWGDIERPVFARSAIKPLQALPLVESGAADQYRLGVTELAWPAPPITARRAMSTPSAAGSTASISAPTICNAAAICRTTSRRPTC